MNVVVVDDDAGILNLVADVVRASNHGVRAFANPLAALDFVRQIPDMDLVISDVVMPEMNGFDLAAQVCAERGASPPKTLLISGNDESRRLQNIDPGEVIGLLPKPFGMDVLTRAIGFIERTRACCPGIAGFGCATREQCGGDAPDTNRCATADYAACPYYASGCARLLREWIGNEAPIIV